MTSRAADAQLCYAVLCTEDAYLSHLGQIETPLDLRLASAWNVRAYLVGQDALFRQELSLDSSRVCYGWLLESKTLPGSFLLTVRGTTGLIEWLEDSEFFTTQHPKAGRVEAGFWGLYRTLALRVSGHELPLVTALSTIVDGGRLMVAGHSLGAALATYLALDVSVPLAHNGASLSARFFASPRTGNDAFCSAVVSAIPDYASYANSGDLVPRIPFAFGYEPLPGLIEMPPYGGGIRIKFGLAAQHHAASYVALLDPAFVPVLKSNDATYARCILNDTPR